MSIKRMTWVLAGLLAVLVAGPALAVSYTWNGGGASDSWTDGNNWGGIAPSGDCNTNAIVFSGATRLTPAQDIKNNLLINSLTFDGASGAFVLGGLMDFGTYGIIKPPVPTLPDGILGYTCLTLGGSTPSITSSSSNNIVITGPINAASGNNTVDVSGSGSLQVSRFTGGTGNTIVKTGTGKLIIYEPSAGLYLGAASSNVAPRLYVNDGTVEVGTRQHYYLGTIDHDDNALTPLKPAWRTKSDQLKVHYELRVGDGVGAAQSAVLQVVGTTDPVAGIATTVYSDGKYDLGTAGHATATNALFTIDHGLVTSSGGIFNIGGSAATTATRLDMTGGSINCTGGGHNIYLYGGVNTNAAGDGAQALINCSTTIRLLSGTGNWFTVADTAGQDVDLLVNGLMQDGSGGLVKKGAGTMKTTGNHTYSGTTAIEGGTYLLTGTTSGQDTYTVMAGATLGGTGTIGLKSGALVTVQDNGILSPGLSVGQLTITRDLTLEDGAVLEWELGNSAAEYDMVDVQGTLSLGATATIKLFKSGSYDPTSSDVFVLFTDNAASNATWTFDYGTTGWSGGQILIDDVNEQVILTGLSSGVIPEPGTMLLLGTGMLGAFGYLRRRRMS